MNKIKELIISLLIISCFSLYGNDETKENEIKKNEKELNKIYFRRNSTIYSATEYYIYRSLFPLTNINDTNNFNYNTFGYQRFIKNSKLSFETYYFENKKTNMETQSLRFNFRGDPFVSYGNLGTYYRTEANFLVHYHFIENRISAFAGIQQIKSNLSQSSTYYFNYDFSQNYKGVTFGLNLETPRFYSFYLNLGFKHSMLYGNIGLNYSIVENSRLFDFSIYKDNVFTKYFLNEYKIALCYEINESTILSIGLIDQFARISENSSKLQGYSTDVSFRLRTLFNGFISFESFSNTFISLSRTF